MDNDEASILDSLPTWVEKLETIRETILATTVMISEIPAPTFHESKRAHFLAERFGELEMLNTSVDEKGNVLGIIPGNNPDRDILVTAHLDTLFSEKTDHTVTLTTSHMIGPGISDNSLGLAVLVSLPIILDRIDMKLDSNLVLVGSSRSLGNGDLAGIRFILDNYKRTFAAAVCLEGVRLGRLSYTSIGMLRGNITYSIPEQYDWTKFDSVGAIVDMNDIINRILEIPLPRKPRTNILLGQMEAGTSYNTLPVKALLRFEIRSESEEIVADIASRIQNLVEETSSRTGALVKFREVSRRKPGGTDFSHPLNRMGKKILEHLEICPRLTPSTSEVSAFIAKNIPAVTIGLTNGENAGELDESINIEPIPKGLAQLAALLKTVDAGCVDGN